MQHSTAFLRGAALVALAICFGPSVFAQEPPEGESPITPSAAATPATHVPTAAEERRTSSRIFGIIPNHSSTSLDFHTAKPLTVKEKFKLSTQNVTDPGAFLMAGLFSGIGQWANQYASFGQGMKGYGRRYGMMYTDIVTTEYLSRAIVPSLFRQDPRYFRLGEGSTGKRVRYALRQLIVTRCDNYKSCLNYGEIFGNAAQVVASNYYYPKAERTGSNMATKLVIGIAPDAASNLLKEFWPDIARRMQRKKSQAAPATKTP